MSSVQIKTVTPDEAGMRLDRWFRAHFPLLRHGDLEKLLRKGQIRVDGGRSKANRRLEAGDAVRVPPLSDDAAVKPKRVNASNAREDAAFIHAHTIFEDKAILAINKPFGLAVQGGTKTHRHIDAMLAALEQNGERPRLVHRLDRDTGGLLLLAKTRRTAQTLGEAFRNHKVEKDYWALVVGAPRPRQGTIDLPIAKRMVLDQERVVAAPGEDAKTAITDYQIIDEAAHRAAFVAMRPVTGRTHQLRVHSAAIGCPVVGDGKYGGALAHIEGVANKLHLFCRAMNFAHPVTGRQINLRAPLTGHMAETWKFFAFDPEADYEWPQDLR